MNNNDNHANVTSEISFLKARIESLKHAAMVISLKTDNASRDAMLVIVRKVKEYQARIAVLSNG